MSVSQVVYDLRVANVGDIPSVTASALKEAVRLCRRIAKSAPSGGRRESLYSETVSLVAVLNTCHQRASDKLTIKALDTAIATLKTGEIALFRTRQQTPNQAAQTAAEAAYSRWLKSVNPAPAKARR